VRQRGRRRTADAGNGAGGCAVLLYGQYGGFRPHRQISPGMSNAIRYPLCPPRRDQRSAEGDVSSRRRARHGHRPAATRELFSGPRRTVRNSLRETSGTGWANWVSRSRPVRRRCFPEEGRSGIAWVSRELTPPLLNEAAALFEDGQTVREVAAVLRISKSEAGRLRQRAVEEGLLGRGGGGKEQSSIVRLVPSSPTVGE
jgi:hypothetical protein